jgi:hypothetical protein
MSLALPNTALSAGFSTLLGAPTNNVLDAGLQEAHHGTHTKNCQKWLWIGNRYEIEDVIRLGVIVNAVKRLVAVSWAWSSAHTYPWIVAWLMRLGSQVQIRPIFMPAQMQRRLSAAGNKEADGHPGVACLAHCLEHQSIR